MSYVYLKLNAFDNSTNDLSLDVIPLLVSTVNVQIQRTVPAFPIPLSSIARGESITVGVDLGMASKSITLGGVIRDMSLKRSHTKSSGSPIARDFTAHEVAQMIGANVDSSGLAKYQNINELTIFIDSKVSSTYTQRSSTIKIPLNFASRGIALEKDNELVAFPFSEISDVNEGGEGIKGFIESFDYTLDAETVEVAFNMTFRQASIFP